jgi:hypothetical protein
MTLIFIFHPIYARVQEVCLLLEYFDVDVPEILQIALILLRSDLILDFRYVA